MSKGNASLTRSLTARLTMSCNSLNDLGVATGGSVMLPAQFVRFPGFAVLLCTNARRRFMGTVVFMDSALREADAAMLTAIVTRCMTQ
jgi:hypothetical protein